MNEKSANSLISEKSSKAVTQRDVAVETSDSITNFEDGEIGTPRSTYESLYWLFNYSKMFTARLVKDMFLSILSYIYPDRPLPDHIEGLLRAQKALRTERESHTSTYNSSREFSRPNTLQLSVKHLYKAFKSYILSSEDDIGLQCQPPKDYTYGVIDREPMFVIVDSSCVSNPSSKELLIDNKTNNKERIMKKYFNRNVITTEMPSTSKDHMNMFMPPQLRESESREEMQMIDINLQSENELTVDENDDDGESIVVSYLRNKDAFSELEELSESSLDVYIPSFPGSPRSLQWTSGSETSTTSEEEEAYCFHEDNTFLLAAEAGNVKLLEVLIRRGTNIQEVDQLGRTALHLAVCSGNEAAIVILLEAGVLPNVKDQVGMTPLSLSLMRSPSITVTNLLFDYGAKLLPRSTPVDTGLFLQFVMMTIPTSEEERILKLLVEKGGLIDDPEAPGGRQALHFAAMSNNCSLIKILVSMGADLFNVNHRNETPKDVAWTFDCKEAFHLLQRLENDEIPRLFTTEESQSEVRSNDY